MIRDEHWWLPLLGLYQGARLEELCQLRGEDVFKEHESGVYILNFHKGMNLKTKAAIRQVPVHGDAIDLFVTGDSAGAVRDNLNLIGGWSEAGTFTSSAVTGTETTFKIYASAGSQIAVQEGLDLVVA